LLPAAWWLGGGSFLGRRIAGAFRNAGNRSETAEARKTQRRATQWFLLVSPSLTTLLQTFDLPLTTGVAVSHPIVQYENKTMAHRSHRSFVAPRRLCAGVRRLCRP